MPIIELIIAVVSSSALTSLFTEIFRRKHTRAEVRRVEADADHVVTDTTVDLIAQIKLVYESRIQGLERELGCVQASLSTRNQELVSLMQDFGKLRKSLEQQSINIAKMISERAEHDKQIKILMDEVSLWKRRVIELLGVMRDGKPVPEWVKEIPRE